MHNPRNAGRLRTAAVLCILAAAALGAQESDAVRIDTVEPNFFYNQQSGLVSVNFFIYLGDFDRDADKVASIRIDSLNDAGWDIALPKYRNNGGKYFGGWGFWNTRLLDANATTAIYLDYLVTVKLKDGSILEKSCQLFGPSGRSGADRPRFLYSPDFRGLVTHMHEPVLAVPVLRDLWRDAGTLHIRFTADDPATANFMSHGFDAAGVEIASLASFREKNGAWRNWLNDGKGLLPPGQVNEIAVPLDAYGAYSGKKLMDIACLSLSAMDGSGAGQRNGLGYVHRSMGRTWKINEAPGLALESLPAARLSPMETGASPWTDRDFLKWENNLAGILLMRNGDPFNTLPLDKAGASAAATNVRQLESDWGIVDRAGLVDMVSRYLEGGGHSERYRNYLKTIAANPGLGPEELLAKAAGKNLTLDGFRFCLYYQAFTGGHDLLGWDLGRMARVCRSGYSAGFLSEDEARYWLYRIGEKARREFSSWKEWGENFLIGRMFWGGKGQEYRLYLEAQSALSKLYAPGAAWAGEWPAANRP